MLRFILILFALAYLIFMAWRIKKGYRINVIDSGAIVIAAIMVGSMIYYIFTTN